MSGSTVGDVNLAGCSFSNVNMSGAVFDDCNLSGWKIHNVNLAGLKIVKANLAGAAITQGRMEGMTIDGILVSDLPVAPLYYRGRMVLVKPWVQNMVITPKDDYPGLSFLPAISVSKH